jgi:hypothetical protein
VIGRAARPLRRHAIHAAHIDEERDELVGARGEFPRLREAGRLVGEQFRVMQLDHAGAGAGRRDDVIIAGEGSDGLAPDRSGVGPVARIVGGLAAAGLGMRHLDRAARLFQKLHGGKADARPEQIDQAGHQQRDARRLGHLH